MTERDDSNTADLVGRPQEKQEITSRETLKDFLLGIRERMSDRSGAPIYALSALNYVMNLQGVYDLMDEENKEIARDIWLHLKQSGFQLKNPPLLFGDEDGQAASR